MKVYTIGREGWEIRPEVTAAINKQTLGCELVQVTTEGGNDEENRARNWNKVKEMCETDIIVKMDADVILVDKDAIKILVETLEANDNADMTVMPTTKIQQREKWGHALYAIRKDKMPCLPEHTPRDICLTCEAIQNRSIIFIDNLQSEYGK